LHKPPRQRGRGGFLWHRCIALRRSNIFFVELAKKRLLFVDIAAGDKE
jgi:hypothetical protein